MNQITNSGKNTTPKEKMVKLFVFVDPEIKQKIQELAKQDYRKPSEMLRVLVMKGLEQMGRGYE